MDNTLEASNDFINAVIDFNNCMSQLIDNFHFNSIFSNFDIWKYLFLS